ncbi:MAG: OadG family protein [Parabacteroides sp.]|nr:OadG family protein [Parabacteroides sp.]
MENIETGLLLMVVGMTTVFAILLIVINLGKGLIALVNKYAPEEIIAKKPVATAVRVQTATPTQATAIGNLSGQEAAAIVSAISAVTRGQRKVIKIEKV